MQEKITEKLFFGKFDHRVIIFSKVQYYTPANSPHPHPAVIKYVIDKHEFKGGFRLREGTSGSGPYRSRKPIITIYFSDPELLTTLQAEFGGSFMEITKPMSTDHSEAMLKDRVLVRNKLYHNKYRFCIRTARKWIPNTAKSTTSHMKNMVDWTEETFPNHTKDDMYIYQGWTTNFYFNNPADVLLMKLTWADDIERTERIKLVSELETQPPSNDE